MFFNKKNWFNVINFICIDTLSTVNYIYSQGYQGIYIATQNIFFKIGKLSVWQIHTEKDRNRVYCIFSRLTHAIFPILKKIN